MLGPFLRDGFLGPPSSLRVSFRAKCLHPELVSGLDVRNERATQGTFHVTQSVIVLNPLIGYFPQPAFERWASVSVFHSDSIRLPKVVV